MIESEGADFLTAKVDKKTLAHYIAGKTVFILTYGEKYI
jgi:hypothetical protein